MHSDLAVVGSDSLTTCRGRLLLLFLIAFVAIINSKVVTVTAFISTHTSYAVSSVGAHVTHRSIARSVFVNPAVAKFCCLSRTVVAKLVSSQFILLVLEV